MKTAVGLQRSRRFDNMRAEATMILIEFPDRETEKEGVGFPGRPFLRQGAAWQPAHCARGGPGGACPPEHSFCCERDRDL